MNLEGLQKVRQVFGTEDSLWLNCHRVTVHWMNWENFTLESLQEPDVQKSGVLKYFTYANDYDFSTETQVQEFLALIRVLSFVKVEVKYISVAVRKPNPAEYYSYINGSFLRESFDRDLADLLRHVAGGSKFTTEALGKVVDR